MASNVAVAAPFVTTQQYAATQHSSATVGAGSFSNSNASTSFSASASLRTSGPQDAFATQSLNAYYATHGVPKTGAAAHASTSALPSSGAASLLPPAAAWRQPQQQDKFVEQYYCAPGPDYSVPDYNSFAGVPGMHYRFPTLNQNMITRHSEATWSSGRAPWAHHQSPSIEGGKKAPYPVRILPPTVAPPTGSTQRFRESKQFLNGEYLGPHVLAESTDFRPQTPSAVSHSPVVNRGAAPRSSMTRTPRS
jgi:hypothetical protein